LMHRSTYIALFLSKIMPRSLAFSGSIVSRTLSKAILPVQLQLYKKTKKTGAVLIILFLTLMAILLTDGIYLWISVVIGAFTAIMFTIYARKETWAIIRHVNYANLGVSETAFKHPVTTLVSGMIGGAVGTIYLVAVSWRIYWAISLFVLLGYFLYSLYLFLQASKILDVSAADLSPAPRHLMKRIHLPKRHHKGHEDKHLEILNNLKIPKDIKYHSRMLRREFDKGNRL